jgi:hypothetical protein
MPDPKPTYLTRREFLKWGTNTSLALFLAACGLLPGDTPLRKDNVSPTGPSAPPPPSTPPPPRQPTPTIEAGSTIPGQKLDIGGGLLELKTYSGVELANRIGAKDKGLKVVTDDKGSITFFTGYAGLNGRQTQEAVLAQAPPGFKWDEKNSLWRKENEIFIPDILLPGDWHPEKNMAGPSHEADVVFLLKDKDNYRIGIIYGKDKMSGIPDKSKLIILPDGSGLYLGGQKNITPGKGEQIIRADDDSLLWINASGDYHRKATSWQHITSEGLLPQAINFAGPLALNRDIPYPSEKLMDTKATGAAIVNYAKVHNNKNPEEVKRELKPILRVGKNNVQFATYETTDGTPLFIATQDPKTKEWGWREATLKNLGQYGSLPQGTTVDFGDRTRTNPKYNTALLNNFGFMTINGATMEQWWSLGGTEYWTNLAIREHMPIRMNYLFFPLDKYPDGFGSTKEEVKKYMEFRNEKFLSFAKKLKEANIQFEISLANEPTFYYNGKLYWQGEASRKFPPFEAFGKSWATEAYVSFYQAAIRNGLIPGKDFRIIGMNERGIELPGERTNAVMNEFIRIKKEIGQRLNMPWEQVPFDLGIEFHTGNTLKDRDVTVPFDQINVDKIVENLRQIKEKTGSDISITELDGLGDERSMGEAYYKIILAARRSGVVKDINFFRTLAQPGGESDHWRSQLFSIPAFEKNLPYYSSLRALSENVATASK